MKNLNKDLHDIYHRVSAIIRDLSPQNESHSCCDIPVMNTLRQLGPGSLSWPHTPCCSVAHLQTDELLSTSASPEIHKPLLAQTDTWICVGLREEESARCLKSLQQAFPLAWAQLGGIPNTSCNPNTSLYSQGT